MKMDLIKDERGKDRQTAITFGNEVISEALKYFKEPTREGTPKGDKIGFSTKKYNAALQMIFYPNCFSLKEIADRIETTEGTLRVWRTQEDFKIAAEVFEKAFTELIYKKIDRLILRQNISFFKWSQGDDSMSEQAAEELASNLGISKTDIKKIKAKCAYLGDDVIILKSELIKYEKSLGHIFKTNDELLASISQGKKPIIIDDDPKKINEYKGENDPYDEMIAICNILPFYSANISKEVICELVTKFKDGIPGYSSALLHIQKSFKVWNKSDLNEWKKTPAMVSLRNTMIEKYIDDLADPGIWKILGEEQMKRFANNLKMLVFENNE